VTRLEFLRRSGGRTQVQLAQAARLSPGRISMFERGVVVPPHRGVELQRLAIALGLPPASGSTLLDEVNDDGR